MPRTNLITPLAILAAVLILGLASPAPAQFIIPWYTIDGGGGTSTGGSFALTGTVGQPDTGPALTGATFTATGGFWSPLGEHACRADFNQSGALTVQDIFDFLAAWFAGQPSADFNGIGGIAVQDIFDFLAAWFAGCA
jgi:hypothetical protein